MNYIELTGKYGVGKRALVDSEDFKHLNQWKWHVNASGGYVVRGEHINGIYKSIRMHRLIMNTPKELQVDHINGNKIDNRKINLRNCNNQQNASNIPKRTLNKSGYKGVCYFSHGKRIKRWLARIKVNYKTYRLGYFLTKEQAALAYDDAAKKHFGEFAKLNFT